MNNIVDTIKGQIVNVVLNSIKKGMETGEMPKSEGEISVNVEKPREKSHGDFAVTTAMQLAKAMKMPPRAIAEVLIKNFDFEGTYIDKCEIAGPGFINIRLKDGWLLDSLKMVEECGENYGKQDFGKGKKVMIEFVSANPTGPMHMGNARGGAIGDSLAAAMQWAGYDVTREFYLNDAGNQIEKLGKSLEARYIQCLKGEDAIEFPEDGYHGNDIKTHMESFIEQNGDKYLTVESEERRKVFTEYALTKNIANLKTGLGNYRINYDIWFHETALYESGEVEETIEMLKKSGHTYENEGALWFKATDFGAEKDDVLVRNNGIPTYFAVDIAYHRNKFLTRGFDKVINIWGADHHGHVARMKGAMQAIGVDPSRLDIIIMQLVRLMRSGEIVRMSKRTGEMVTLSDLIEDTGVDAARFFFNLRSYDSHLDFDLDLAVKESNENPVFYVQYAHARICSMLRLLEQEGIVARACDEIDLSVLQSAEEKEVMLKIAELPEEIRLAAVNYDPARLTRFALDLAASFHSFYNACRVKSEDESVMYPRITLVKAVKTVLANTLSILGVTAPEKM